MSEPHAYLAGSSTCGIQEAIDACMARPAESGPCNIALPAEGCTISETVYLPRPVRRDWIHDPVLWMSVVCVGMASALICALYHLAKLESREEGK